VIVRLRKTRAAAWSAPAASLSRAKAAGDGLVGDASGAGSRAVLTGGLEACWGWAQAGHDADARNAKAAPAKEATKTLAIDR
jgi:hypothetical protein